MPRAAQLKAAAEAPPSLTFTREQIDLIKQTVAKGATDAELQLFLYTSKRTGLDPLTRQIHAIKRWDSAAGKETMAIQTGIDGYRLVANRTGQHAGTTDVLYDREDAEHPNWAKVTVQRWVNGQVAEFPATARWKEYAAYKKDGRPMALWAKMPYLMLGKCAEALALRKAFPQELAGIYTFEEMEPETKIEVAAPVISGSGPAAAPEEQPRRTQPEGKPPTTPHPFDEPAPSTATRKKSTQLKVLQAPPARPHQAALLLKLDQILSTRGDFMAVADKNQWLGKNKHWDRMEDVPDEMFEVFMREDEWAVVVEELKKFRQQMPEGETVI